MLNQNAFIITKNTSKINADLMSILSKAVMIMQIQEKTKVPEAKWVNSIFNIIGVNSLRLGGLQIGKPLISKSCINILKNKLIKKNKTIEYREKIVVLRSLPLWLILWSLKIFVEKYLILIPPCRKQRLRHYYVEWWTQLLTQKRPFYS